MEVEASLLRARDSATAPPDAARRAATRQYLNHTVATFDGPARALRCASAIRDELRQIGFEIRAGLHMGEIELRGDAIGGVAVHIASRVSDLAGQGEILVSGTVTDLVAGSGIGFAPRGEHELKGIPGTWQLFAFDGYGA